MREFMSLPMPQIVFLLSYFLVTRDPNFSDPFCPYLLDWHDKSNTNDMHNTNDDFFEKLKFSKIMLTQ